MALFIVLPLLMAYVGSYAYLSRRGMREAEEYRFNQFLYISVDEALETEDLSRHHKLAEFYAPLNWVDQTFLNAKGPVQGLLFRLSK